MKRHILYIGILCILGTASCSTMRTNRQETALERPVVYRSVDQFSDSLWLSGRVSVPIGKQAKGIILIPHYTIGADKEAPSNHITAEARYFRDDYVLLMPDYLGYGVSNDRFPPYLAGELTARNCVDMIWGTQSVLDSLEVNIPRDSIYIVGYSQGAASAIWTLRLLEESYADRIHVKHCFLGSGPYDVASSYDDVVIRGKTMSPMLVPLLLIGTNVAYDLQVPIEELLTPATNKVVNEYIVSKKYGVVRLFFKMPNHSAKHWISAKGLDKSQPDTRRVYEGFLRSSIVHYPIDDKPEGQDSICPAWQWRTPTLVFHSTKDDAVPVVNALHLQRCFGHLPNVTFDIDNHGNHVNAMHPFMLRVLEILGE